MEVNHVRIMSHGKRHVRASFFFKELSHQDKVTWERHVRARLHAGESCQGHTKKSQTVTSEQGRGELSRKGKFMLRGVTSGKYNTEKCHVKAKFCGKVSW